jgi:hypothetical protein
MISNNNKKNNFKKVPQDLKLTSKRPISTILVQRKKYSNRDNSSTTVKI